MAHKLIFKRALNTASPPLRQTEYSAGYDLASAGDYTVAPGRRALVSTGLIFAIPDGYYGQIADRSGLSWKHGLKIMAGVIDSDYRGVVHAVILNTSNKEFKISVGD